MRKFRNQIAKVARQAAQGWKYSVMAVIFVACAAATLRVNSNVGYSPVQPLPFSHQLHSGDHHIPCQYCHAGVQRSTEAPIPPLNVCMGCHAVVAKDKPDIKALAAAYAAGTPVQWVRVYSLPQFVKFNHGMHVNAGLECQTCHGDVQNMPRVRQVREFSMGQCLDCHRNNDHLPRVADIRYRDAAKSHGHPVNAPYDCNTCHT
jgi:hypothetical protein